MKEKNKKKKINNMSFSECKEILEKLSDHPSSQYYQQVLKQFNSLLPKQKEYINHSKD